LYLVIRVTIIIPNGVEKSYKTVKQSQVSITDKYHLVCSGRKVENAPLNMIYNAVIHVDHKSCFTHSNNRGKIVY
jgi:hypothetical protein